MSQLVATNPFLVLILAQADEGYGSIFLWLGVLIVLLVAGFFGVSWIRRWLKEEPVATAGSGFTLSDLRELRRRGQISEEEFERAKGKIVAAAQRAAEREAERQANLGRGGSSGLKRNG